MLVSQIISSIPEKEKTPVVLQLVEIIQLQSEQIQALKDEIARLKGHKPKPDIKPSNLTKKDKENPSENPTTKRPGSAKKKKTNAIEIHNEEVIKPEDIPEGSTFKGFHDYVFQDVILRPYNTRYRLERWRTPDGTNIVGKLPEEVKGVHFGPGVKGFILYQHYQNHVTQPLILEQLTEIGIDISSGQISRILIEDKDQFHAEKEDILRVGVEVSEYVHADDTGARHDRKNGYCTHIGNEFFAYFESTESKSRINFLKVLRGGFKDYVVNSDAIVYMGGQKLPQKFIHQLLSPAAFPTEQDWLDHLASIGVTSPRHIQIATEGALIGSVIEHGLNPGLVLISDDAGQFNLFIHGLCWIHAERTISKLVGFNDDQRAALEQKKSEIWDYYGALKGYKNCPSEAAKAALKVRFDEIFQEKTCFASLNKALERLHKNKNELLLVLDFPNIPLHNNLSENDIREYVKRRKISGSTRSPDGRRCRDTFTSLKKTCRKLGISFWDYLMNRLGGKSDKDVPYLPDQIRMRVSEDIS